MWRLVMLVVGILSLVGCSTVPHSFRPADPLAPIQFSYQSFEDVLSTHVHDGVVSYPGIAADPRFALFLRQLDRIDPNSLPTRNDRLAFWINAYNAFAIKGILDGGSPLTLLGRYRYFIAKASPVGGAAINLYDLEQKVLIPDFREPRIHFAIVCASRSCPKLKSWIYRPERLEEQLEQSARDFINDPTRNRFDREGKIAYLSQIFGWFEPEFAAAAGSLRRYVARYIADPELARAIETVPYDVQFLTYDWRLNGIPPEMSSRADSSR